MFLKNRSPFDYSEVLNSVGVRKTYKCMEWAFGKGFKQKIVRNCCEIWNRRHPGLFKLKGSGSVVGDLQRIGKEYLRYQ